MDKHILADVDAHMGRAASIGGEEEPVTGLQVAPRDRISDMELLR